MTLWAFKSIRNAHSSGSARTASVEPQIAGCSAVLKGLLHLARLGFHVVQIRRKPAGSVIFRLQGSLHEGLVSESVLAGDEIALTRALIGAILGSLVREPSGPLGAHLTAVRSILRPTDNNNGLLNVGYGHAGCAEKGKP
jgi:hypothetical protein